jgi:hypothetical protein
VGDAFGNALGGSIAEGMQPGGSVYQDGDVGRSELIVNYRMPQWSQDDQDRYEGLVSAFENFRLRP